MLHNLYGSWAKKLRHVHHKTIRKVQNFLIFSLKKGLSELTCGAIFFFEDAVFSFRPWQIICGCSKPYLHTELLLHVTFANMSRQIVGVWPIIVFGSLSSVSWYRQPVRQKYPFGHPDFAIGSPYLPSGQVRGMRTVGSNKIPRNLMMRQLFNIVTELHVILAEGIRT